jgi:hypothetical protein
MCNKNITHIVDLLERHRGALSDDQIVKSATIGVPPRL